MPVNLQVRAVHDALFRAAGGPSASGAGAPSTLLLGRLFHEVFAELIGADPQRSLQGALAEQEPDAAPGLKRKLVLERIYARSVGPRLRRNQAVLQHASAHVVAFWRAVQELCDWLLEIHAAHGRFQPAEPLACTLRDPAWADSVCLSGVPDGLVHVPGAPRWCVVELKLGRTSPEADLAQTCLYHRMLTESLPGQSGALALVSFEPQRRERLFEAAELAEAHERLSALVGRLAGVIAPSPAPAPAPDRPAARAVPRPAAASADPYRALGERLRSVLCEYGAPVQLAGPTIVGPTFLRFPVVLDKAVKVSALQSRTDELRVRLGLEAAPRVAIERRGVVIDLERPDRQFIPFSAIVAQIPAADPRLGSPHVALGVSLDGTLELADLTQPENAHVLVAGTTGSGKSEWLRTALASLIAANTPETLRLLLIDPKRNAFTALRDSPFLYAPIVYPDEQPPIEVLARLADEMDARYERMGEQGADTLLDHVRQTGAPLPRIVCVCDEYADLVLKDRKERKELEGQVFRLGSKARAAGIHLILATQQPSREIIKGALDANISARVALKMNSAIESRMLLNGAGAENLLGCGDLLFKNLGDPIRLQSAYVPAEERERYFAQGTRVAV